jgi:putative FmdB family regulatory protein
MPTYDYVCEKCGHKFEEMQSFKDDPLKTCPKCHQDALRRLFGTGAAILFKGSGFYETDYRSDGYKKAAEADTKPSESKPADTKKADAPAAKPAGDKPATGSS